MIGSGTVLDSARLRYLLSRHCGVDVHNVHAYMLGEHGDSEFAAWSMVHLGGISMTSYCPTCRQCGDWDAERAQIEQTVRDSAYHVIDYKGATFYAVGLALVRIAGAILRNEHSVLTISTVLDGEYGLHGVSLSVPCIVAEEGVAQVLQTDLWPQEQQALIRSADVIRSALADLGPPA